MSSKMALPAKRTTHPSVVFLLGAASATALILYFYSCSSAEIHLPAGAAALRYSRNTAITPCSASLAGNETAAKPQNAIGAGDTDHEGGGGDDDGGEFERILAAAALEDRTVIMTSVNEAWAAPGSLLDAFLESFRVGENVSAFAEHIVVLAMEPGALRHCRAVHRHCYLLRQRRRPGVDLAAAKSYMTKDYLDLVWSKVALQQRVLELGYHLLFTDVDLAWFRNPMEHITLAPDISTSSDFYFGDPDALGNYPNTGFIFFKSSRKNIQVMKHWRRSRKRFPGHHDQYVFNAIKEELAPKFGVRLKFLDTKHISGFCQLGRDLNAIATVHMTCCIGLENKLHDLRRVIADWRRYAAQPLWERPMGKVGWTFEGGKCIH